MSLGNLEESAREVAAWLSSHSVQYALIGGIAVSFRTIERTTKDIDFAVAVRTDSDAESVIRGLRGLGYEVHTLLEQSRMGRIATVRLIKKNRGKAFIDLLFASSGIEREVATGAEEIEIFPKLRVPVANISALLALKVLAADEETRPQDILDIKSLLTEARASDIAETKKLLKLITKRSFNRGENLQSKFTALLKRFRREPSRLLVKLRK